MLMLTRRSCLRSHHLEGLASSPIYRLKKYLSTLVKESDSFSNITPQISDKLGRNLHLNRNHPLGIVKKRIEMFCTSWAIAKSNHPAFSFYDNLSPKVSTKQCFDDLLVPPDHVSRSKSDTYYIDPHTILRTHTSAHQTEIMAKKESSAFLCSGDVYRRDEIDSTHYPVFHQIEGVRIYPRTYFASNSSMIENKVIVEKDLKELLEGLAMYLFGDVPFRWREDYFPFTNPSFELEVEFNGQWLEVLGCGVIHDAVLRNAIDLRRIILPNALNDDLYVGWAFGLGLERLAMVLFGIPDIRLFWSTDKRFLSQFSEEKGISTMFTPFSKYPMCYKDVSFWLPGKVEDFPVNDLYEVIRGVAGDLVERVQKFDEFVNKDGVVSQAYRIEYRHLGRSLTNAEIDDLQMKVREALVAALHVKLR